MKYVFQPGDRGVFTGKHLTLSGKTCTIRGGLAKRTTTFSGFTQTVDCYEVEFDCDKGNLWNIKPHALALIPPTRSDMDTKVSWASLPVEVMLAMRGGDD